MCWRPLSETPLTSRMMWPTFSWPHRWADPPFCQHTHTHTSEEMRRRSSDAAEALMLEDSSLAAELDAPCWSPRRREASPCFCSQVWFPPHHTWLRPGCSSASEGTSTRGRPFAHLNSDYPRQRLARVGSALDGDAQRAGVLHHLDEGGGGERGERGGAGLLGHNICSVSWNLTSNL